MSTDCPFDDRDRAGPAGARPARSLAEAALEALSIHLAIVDPDGTIILVNGAWRRFAEGNAEDATHLSEGGNYFTVCDTARGPGSEGAAAFGEGLRAVLGGRQAEFNFEYPCHAPLEQRWFLGQVTRFLGEDQRPHLVVTHTDITARKRLEEQVQRLNEHLGEQVQIRTHELELERECFAAGAGLTERERQRQVRLQQVRMGILEGLASKGSLETLQGMLIDHIQEVWPDHPVTFRLLDRRMGKLNVVLNRGLPEFYTAALTGLAIGPGVGCSAAAAHTRTRIVAEDIQTHPNWVPFRELAARAGLGACWSEPVFASDGEVLGTFAVYARHPERPEAADLNILHEVAALATLLYERRQDEAELGLRDAAMKAAANAMVIIDRAGLIQWANPAFADLTGYDLQELPDRHIRILKSGRHTRAFYDDLWSTVLSGRAWHGELCNRRKDGTEYLEDQVITPVCGPDGAATHFISIRQDVTARKAAETRLKVLSENRRRLSAALEQAEDAAVIMDLEGAITFANRAFLRVLGVGERRVLAEPIGSFLEDPEQPGRLEELLAMARGGQYWKGRHRVRGPGGGPLTLDGTVSPVRNVEGDVASITAVFRDVTLEIERGRQLIQAQKMDSLGALAGGVAHDFNNILSSILISAEMIEWQLEPDSPIRPRLEVIYQVSQQARELSRRILSFSRRSEDKLIPFDLSNLVREACRLLKATLPKNVTLKTEIASSVWVTGDPAQAHQVVMNLAINGSHAIGSREGHLTLTLAGRALTETGGLPMVPGTYAELCVRDTGSGMGPEVLERIFEPFFTTKDAETGTGLGLSVVHGIVHSHGGHLKVESAVGQGSCFRVFFPSAEKGDEAPLAQAGGEVRGSERILLVDDEDIVAALTKQGLQGLGYEVIAKTSPLDALEVFQTRPEAFDLLITDLALPGFSGAELARRIRRLRPDLPALLTTGTAGMAESMPSLAETFAEILAKPLAPKELGAAIRRVMDSRRAGLHHG